MGNGLLLDVRSAEEFQAGHMPGSANIPIDELRPRIGELPTDRQIYPYCQVGQRGYLATRILMQTGLHAANIGGGYETYLLSHPVGET